jgi:hypothetical protein
MKRSQVTPDADYYDLRQMEIERLGIAGFLTETGNGKNLRLP